MKTAKPLAPIFKLLLALGLGLSAGLLAQRYALPWFDAHLQVDPPTPRPTLAEHEIQGASGAVHGGQAQPSAKVRFQAGIVFPDDPQVVNEGKVGLLSGTRLQINIRSEQAGRVKVWATNPAGVRSGPLWVGQVAASNPVLSPTLRLEGPTGLERLDIELLNAAGERVAHRTLEIWHQ
jgi:hypothetical protein